MTTHLLEKKLAIGVDLGGTKLAVGLVDSEGAIKKQLFYLTDVKGGVHSIEEQIKLAVEELKMVANGAIAGIGIGVPGQIEKMTGFVHFAPNLQWRNIHIKANLEKQLNLPVYVTNDVRASAMGEWIFGAGKGYSDIVCMFIGTGIGGAVISDGVLLTGCKNSAGEIGHMIIDLYGPSCTCGSRGCLEAKAGGWGIARNAQSLALLNPEKATRLIQIAETIENISAKTVVEAFKEQDPMAKTIMEDICESLIAGATNVVNIFNPQILILGGGFVDGFPEIVKIIEEGLKKKALKIASKNLIVQKAALSKNAGVIGAATLSF